MFRNRIGIKQRDLTDCGPACIVSIAAHYGLRIDLQSVRYRSSTGRNGTSISGMLYALESYGFQAKGIRASVQYLRERQLPVIALIKKGPLHHYVVLYGIKKKIIRYMDPALGKLQKCTWEQFEANWEGVLITVERGVFFTPGRKTRSFTTRLLILLQPYRSRLFQAFLGSLVYTLLGLSTSIYIQKITDQVLMNHQKQMLNLMSLGMFLILAFMIFISWNRFLITMKIGQLIDAKVITGYFNYVLNLPQHFFDKMRTGEITSRISDAVKIRAFISEGIIGFLVNLLIVIFSFLIMFLLYWKLALMMVLIIPVYALFYYWMNEVNSRTERRVMENWAKSESHMISSIEAIQTIKSYNLSQETGWKNEINTIQLLESFYRSGMNALLGRSFTEFISRGSVIGLFWIGSYHVIQQNISMGELLAFYSLLGYFNGPLQNLMSFNKIYQNARIAVDRLFEIEQLEEFRGKPRIDFQPDMNGDVQFKEVSFRYGPGKDVLRKLTFTLKQGSFTAIVGKSGSGKTTILSLIQKLYIPVNGQIFIGRDSLEYLTEDSLRKSIGIIPQFPGIISGTVLENIAMGELSPDLGKIEQICREYDLGAYFDQFPEGLFTYLGEGGTNLSGGQKQMLGLIRVRYLDPQIVLLDEPVSMLDPTSSKLLPQIIKYFRRQGKTIVLVTHRLDHILDADHLMVMEHGRILESGNPKELLNSGKHFRQLWEDQYGEVLALDFKNVR